MTLSIIIPHYNSPVFLKVLLDSIGHYDDTQIIVVDDHSTKETEKYQALKSDPAYAYVTFVSNQDGKKGAGSARNTGLKLAQGKYLMFCDADDYLVQGYRTVIEPYLRGETELVYFTPISRYVGSDQDAHRTDKFIELVKAYLDHPCEKTEDALRLTFYIPSSKLILKDMVVRNQIQFDETMVSNDVMFSTKAGALAKSIAASSQTIYCLTRSEGTLTTTRLEKNFDTRFEIGLKLHDYIRSTIGEKRYRQIDLPALVYVLQAFQYKLGLKKAWWVIRRLKAQKIRILPLTLFTSRRIRKPHLG